MTDSIHTARWIKLISGLGWEIHLFSSTESTFLHPDIENVVIHFPVYGKQHRSLKKKTIKFRGLYVRNNFLALILIRIVKKFYPQYKLLLLKKKLKKLKPDILHSMETQNAGYLISELKKTYSVNLPKWIHSVWGSDLYLFGRLSEHRSRIREVLENCEYFFSESKRDILLSEKYGFKGKVLPIVQATGGFDFNYINTIRKDTIPSKRKAIVLKGYQSWAGRALVGLRALERCNIDLRDFKVIIYLPSPDVILAAKLFAEATGVEIEIIPNGTPYFEILKLYNQARVYIGLSISDGVPNSMLESMVMGALPIQSFTSCADEWITNKDNGLLVPPEDPDIIKDAIEYSLLNDDFVNNAAVINYNVIKERLDNNIVSKTVIDIYNSIYSEK